MTDSTKPKRAYIKHHNGPLGYDKKDNLVSEITFLSVIKVASEYVLN